MKEYNFEKHKLSEDEKIWLTELLKYNFDKIEPRTVKVNLVNKISPTFDPTKIDFRLINNNRLTLLGLWYVDSQHHLFEKTHYVITKIKDLIKNNPKLGSVESLKISSSLNINNRDVNIIFAFLFDLNFAKGGTHTPEDFFRKITFGPEATAFDKILDYKIIEETLENYYIQYDYASSKVVTDITYTLKTSVKKQLEKAKLKKLIARLSGIREVVSKDPYVRKEVGDDFNKTIKQISKVLEEDLTEFFLEDNFWHLNPYKEKYCSSDIIINKLLQAISYLENELNSNQNSDEINILFNSINDEELRSRCADILVAQSHYDRVINQSTLVLENRIRKKADAERNLVGVQLVNKVLNTVISKSVLKLSSNPEEQEGISQICRGIMIGFRNPTHHHLTEKYTQTEALKFCCFVDNILQIIDKAEINTSK